MSDRETVLDAIQRGNLDLLRRLLAASPELAGTRNDQGVSATLLCLYQRRQDLVDVVQSHQPALDAFDAAALGDVARLESLLDEDAEAVRAWSGDGFSALHLACFFGRGETARALVGAGADIDAVATNGSRLAPIHSAAASRSMELMRLLLDHAAAVNVAQTQGWTPLHAAARHGDLEMTTALLAAGSDPALASDDGKLPVDLAEEAGHAEVAQALRRARSLSE